MGSNSGNLARATMEPDVKPMASPSPLPLSRLATRVAYASTQLPRIAWYAGHFQIMRRLAQEVRRRNGEVTPSKPPADAQREAGLERRLDADRRALFAQDIANVEAGIYPLPADHDGSLLTLLDRSRLFFRDLPDIDARRKRNATHEVLSEETRGRRPDYYLQNFHFQSGGWLTDNSADRYDTQVEVLFKGTANAMRRQALPPLAEAFAGRDQRRLRLIDIACGTGRFLDCVKQSWPRLPVLGLDLSDAYIRHARKHLRRWSRAHLRGRQCGSDPGGGQQLRRRDQHLHDARAAARRAPHRVRRSGARAPARRPPGRPGFAPARRRTRLRRDAGALPAPLS